LDAAERVSGRELQRVATAQQMNVVTANETTVMTAVVPSHMRTSFVIFPAF